MLFASYCLNRLAPKLQLTRYNIKPMKPILPGRKGKALLIAAIASLSILFHSCSSKVQFATSTVMPTAEGSVKVKKDGNNNYSTNIDIKHLAHPSRLVPSKEL